MQYTQRMQDADLLPMQAQASLPQLRNQTRGVEALLDSRSQKLPGLPGAGNCKTTQPRQCCLDHGILWRWNKPRPSAHKPRGAVLANLEAQTSQTSLFLLIFSGIQREIARSLSNLVMLLNYDFHVSPRSFSSADIQLHTERLDVEPIDMAPLCPVANGSQPNPELVIAKHAWWVTFASFDLVRP